MFLTEVKISVTLILESKRRICRKFFFAAPFSFDRHNTTPFSLHLRWSADKSITPTEERSLLCLFVWYVVLRIITPSEIFIWENLPLCPSAVIHVSLFMFH